MSGANKKVADVAFKALRTRDWEGMAKVLVSDEARKEFSSLRRAFDEVDTQLQTKFSQGKRALRRLTKFPLWLVVKNRQVEELQTTQFPQRQAFLALRYMESEAGADAGHMVPMDQPKAALKMLKGWMETM